MIVEEMFHRKTVKAGGFMLFERVYGKNDYASFWRSRPYPHVTVVCHIIHKRCNFTGCYTIENCGDVLPPLQLLISWMRSLLLTFLTEPCHAFWVPYTVANSLFMPCVSDYIFQYHFKEDTG